MIKLFGSLSICLGFYFADNAGRLVILRSIGYSRLFTALDCLLFISPFVSFFILLYVGFTVIHEKTDPELRILAKFLMTFVVALIPLGVHFAMIKLTYGVNPAPLHLFGMLSAMEWVILPLGCLLIGLGIFLLLRAPSPTGPQN